MALSVEKLTLIPPQELVAGRSTAHLRLTQAREVREKMLNPTYQPPSDCWLFAADVEAAGIDPSKQPTFRPPRFDTRRDLPIELLGSGLVAVGSLRKEIRMKWEPTYQSEDSQFTGEIQRREAVLTVKIPEYRRLAASGDLGEGEAVAEVLKQMMAIRSIYRQELGLEALKARGGERVRGAVRPDRFSEVVSLPNGQEFTITPMERVVFGLLPDFYSGETVRGRVMDEALSKQFPAEAMVPEAHTLLRNMRERGFVHGLVIINGAVATGKQHIPGEFSKLVVDYREPLTDSEVRILEAALELRLNAGKVNLADLFRRIHGEQAALGDVRRGLIGGSVSGLVKMINGRDRESELWQRVQQANRELSFRRGDLVYKVLADLNASQKDIISPST